MVALSSLDLAGNQPLTSRIEVLTRGHSYQIARRNATLVGWLFLPSGKGVAIW